MGYNLFSTSTPLDSSGNVPEPRYKHGIPHWLGTSFSSYERDWFIASIGPRNCSNREAAKNESPFLGLGVGTLMLACMQQMLFCQTYKQPSRTPIIYCQALCDDVSYGGTQIGNQSHHFYGGAYFFDNCL